MFKKQKPETKYFVVEVEKGSKLPDLSSDLKESLKALQHHPAYNYLIMRMRNHKAVLETQLSSGLGMSETDIRYLQAGIYWLGQLERDMKVLTHAANPSREATNQEAIEFAKVREALELVQ